MVEKIILFFAVLGSLLSAFFIAEANRSKLDIKRIDIKKWIGIKWFSRLSDLIDRSTIGHYIPYNVTLHVALSLAVFFNVFYMDSIIHASSCKYRIWNYGTLLA